MDSGVVTRRGHGEGTAAGFRGRQTGGPEGAQFSAPSTQVGTQQRDAQSKGAEVEEGRLGHLRDKQDASNYHAPEGVA